MLKPLTSITLQRSSRRWVPPRQVPTDSMLTVHQVVHRPHLESVLHLRALRGLRGW